MTRAALFAVFVAWIALAGCRTTAIGDPIVIPIPHDLSERDAQSLVTRFVDRTNRAGAKDAGDAQLRKLFATARRPRSVARRYRGRWRVESWQSGSVVAAYAWKRHVLRVLIDFRDRTTQLRIGEGTNLRQTSTRVHRTAKALATELAQDLRFVYGKVASGDPALGAAVRSLGGARSSFCEVRWAGNVQERTSCQHAQREAWAGLAAQIDRVEIEPASEDSRRLKTCYAKAQTRAGTDWVATARCFYGYPAAAR